MPPIPPIGDPRRPLHLAIRSMRLLGLISVLLGIIVGLFAWAGVIRQSATAPSTWLLLMGVLVYLIPGVMYIVFAISLRRRQPWAVVGGMVVAIVQLPFALWAVVMVIQRGANPLSLVLVGLWAAGLVQLIFHLSKSPAAMRFEAIGGARGFEILPPPPAPPPPPLPGERV